jgi:hypothetical protein
MGFCLIGDWVGREGMGFQAWTNYSFIPKSRHAKVAPDFIPGGETLNDVALKGMCWFRRDLTSQGPSSTKSGPLPSSPRPLKTNWTTWTTTVEISFWPKPWIK